MTNGDGVAEAVDEVYEFENELKREKNNVDILTEQNMQLKNKVNELTALLFKMVNQYEQDFFEDSYTFMQRQNIVRAIKARIDMTPEVWEIVNKSKEQPQQ